jgi:hypothetical protein
VAVADVGDFFLAIRGEAGRALVRWPRSYGALRLRPCRFGNGLASRRRRSRAVSYGVESDDRQRGEFISYSE